MRFEGISPGAKLRGIDPAGTAEVLQVPKFGPDATNVIFRVDGRVGERLIYRGETGFEAVEAGRSFGFDANGEHLRLALEAYRIRLAHLFDSHLEVTASQVGALSQSPPSAGDATQTRRRHLTRQRYFAGRHEATIAFPRALSRVAADGEWLAHMHRLSR